MLAGSGVCADVQNKSGKEPGTRAGPVMVAVEAGLLMFGGVASGEVPFAPECWLLQLGPSPLLGLKENEVSLHCCCCLLYSASCTFCWAGDSKQ